MIEKIKTIRCAIYTRKSTEEGLDQEFNSLHAQREAGAAYILSQKHEGWQEIPTLYDDGGFSGGNMERPALKQLLADLDMGMIDVVVVYKVDRLTRSLADFAKIVEKFDKKGISFVSVTQQFNTTSSMGRLTLNVLLSFAQFEREVTAERIRDKIAASKKKGMWMGGNVPLGYEREEKCLIINPAEAEQIKFTFDYFLKCKNVRELRKELAKRSYCTKIRKLRDGRLRGGGNFSLGSIYALIKNPVYAGKIQHKDELYEGRHEGIISLEQWQKVQDCIAKNAIVSKHKLKSKEPSLLKGIIFDINGRPFTPSHGFKKKGKRRYKYYIHNEMLVDKGEPIPTFGNLPAYDTEMVVINAIKEILTRPEKLRSLVDDKSHQLHIIESGEKRKVEIEAMQPCEIYKLVRSLVYKVVIEKETVTVELERTALRTYIIQNSYELLEGEVASEDIMRTRMHVSLRRFKREMRLTVNKNNKTGKGNVVTANPAICKALARSFVWNEKLVSGEVASISQLCRIEKLNERYIVQILRLAWLPPKLVEELLEGLHEGMSLNKLLNTHEICYKI
jgi:DNA invertase Pin-like site-specific DNA recombinase